MWLVGESGDHGLTVTSQEVEQKYAQSNRERFPKKGEFKKFLAFTGENVSDELLLVKFSLMSTKLLQKVIAKKGLTAQQQQRALAQFYKRWIAKTNCRAGYVEPDCRQYKGPITQGL